MCFLRHFSILIFLLVMGSQTRAQTGHVHNENSQKDVNNDSVAFNAYSTIDAPDDLPEPPGGLEGFKKYLAENIRYPDSARKAKAQGKVYIELTIYKDGSFSNVHVKKDEVGCGCGAEAVRVIKAMPKWKPCIVNGKPVNWKYVIPVTFILRD